MSPDPRDRIADIESARSFGRPVVATEALGRPNHGELHKILPLCAEHRIGWYLWELMIGAGADPVSVCRSRVPGRGVVA